jgi:putative ABC transport system permease protein
MLRLVVGSGMKLVAIGLVAGLGAAFGLTRYMSAMLYGVKSSDPLTYVTVALALLAVAFFATYIPARRAAQVDPVIALRYE